MTTPEGSAGPSKSGAVAFAGVVGAIAGASLVSRRGVRAATLGAIVGAVGLGTSEAIARATQGPDEIPALWQRIAFSGALAAPVGWLADRFLHPGPVPVGLVSGSVAGALGLRPQKVAMGPVTGAVVGGAFGSRGTPSTGLARRGDHRRCATDAFGPAISRRADQRAGN